jgi:hypothetical protein
MTQQLLEDTKAVAFLNSMAITMMGETCYKQAAITLNDASMLLMSQAAAQPGPQRHNEMAAEQFETANRFKFNPEPQQSSLLAFFKVIHHDGTAEVSDEVVQGQEGFDKYSVIRTESGEIGSAELSAILLYNYAICWLCQAKNNDQELSVSQSQREQGMQILQASLTFLSQLYITVHCPFTANRIISLMKATGEALVQALESSGQVEAAASLRTTLLGSLDTAARDIVSSGIFACLEAASPAA